MLNIPLTQADFEHADILNATNPSIYRYHHS
jgi:hypothetical protein